MKKILREIQIKIANRSKQKWMKKVTRDKFKKASTRELAGELENIRIRHSSSSIKEPALEYEYLVAPENLSLSENYNECVLFFNDLRKVAFRHKRRPFIDLTSVKSIGPGAALALVAEVYRCRNLFPQRRPNGNYPTNAEARNTLINMGFFALIDAPEPKASKESEPKQKIDYIKFYTSNRVKSILAKQLRVAMELGKSAIGGKVKRRMFEGVKEAMNNAIQHAYPRAKKGDIPRMSKRWWMAGAVDQSQNELMVMFYDQGVGIPATLPVTHGPALNFLRTLMGLTEKDGDTIRAAMAIGKSQTGAAHRGKGLDNIKAFIDGCSDGTLRVLSGRGEYVYHHGGTELTQDRPLPLGGTLIQWNVRRPPTPSLA